MVTKTTLTAGPVGGGPLREGNFYAMQPEIPIHTGTSSAPSGRTRFGSGEFGILTPYRPVGLLTLGRLPK